MANEGKGAAVAFVVSPADDLLVLALVGGLGYLAYRQFVARREVPAITAEESEAASAYTADISTDDPGAIQGGVGAASTTAPKQPDVVKWLIGIGGLWIILTLMVDLGDTADLAVALALVIMGAVLLNDGPAVFTELGISTTAPVTRGG